MKNEKVNSDFFFSHNCEFTSQCKMKRDINSQLWVCYKVRVVIFMRIVSLWVKSQNFEFISCTVVTL